MKELKSVFSIYKSQGFFKALWTVLRVFILPYKKIDAFVPQNGTIIDIGCGNGGLTNYLSLQSSNRNLKGIDFSKERISDALKSVGKRKNIQFIYGNVLTTRLSKVDCYLMVDVLHHISFQDQEKLLHFLVENMERNSQLIIKEVDPSNRIPFLFGHTIEKTLYPKERIYTRSKRDWETIFKSLKLSVKSFPGVFYFPDSTQIFVITKNTIDRLERK